MTKQSTNMTKRLSMWAIVVAAILMIPVLAKLPWTTGDFIFAGVVLFCAATAYEFVTRNMSNKNHQYVAAIVVVAVVFLIWGWAVA